VKSGISLRKVQSLSLPPSPLKNYMTKKDYEKFAEIIKANNINGCIDADELIHRLCNYFYKDNPKFDTSKFISACLD